jgi:3-oxoacyl-[acyl-carrier-protein] synthase-3
MVVLANMIELGQSRCGMVVAGENSRPLLETAIQRLNGMMELTRRELKPWFASLTIGSAAVAVVLAHVDYASCDYRLLGGANLCNTAYNHLCQGDGDTGMGAGSTPVMQTDAEELLKQGVGVARETWGEAKSELGWDNDTPDVVCTHQVGKRHSDRLYEALGLDPQRNYGTVSHLGNCGSASLPATAAMAVEEGRIPRGGSMALLGIGSGINCTMLGVRRAD